MTDRHYWKHYLPATLLARGNKVKWCRLQSDCFNPRSGTNFFELLYLEGTHWQMVKTKYLINPLTIGLKCFQMWRNFLNFTFFSLYSERIWAVFCTFVQEYRSLFSLACNRSSFSKKTSSCQDMLDLFPSTLTQSLQRQLQCLLQCYDWY